MRNPTSPLRFAPGGFTLAALVLLLGCSGGSKKPIMYQPPDPDPKVSPDPTPDLDLNCTTPQTYRELVNCNVQKEGIVVSTVPPLMRSDESMPPVQPPPTPWPANGNVDICPDLSDGGTGSPPGGH